MKKTGIKDNFQVVVTPRDLGNFPGLSVGVGFLYGHGPEAQAQIEHDRQERCDEIAASIKRHTNDVSHVEVIFDQQHVCSHCGADWTEASDSYNGGCCEADEAAHEQSEAA